jgi:hypothetical protein
MARIVSDIEWAIEQASRYQHDSSRWQEKDGAWEAYIAPMLDAVRRALAPNGEAATPDYFAVCDKNGVVLATIPRDRYNRDVFADYSDALGDTHGPLSSIPLFTHPAPAARVTEAMKEKARRALCEVFAEFDDGSWEPASVDELLEVVLTAALSEATNG